MASINASCRAHANIYIYYVYLHVHVFICRYLHTQDIYTYMYTVLYQLYYIHIIYIYIPYSQCIFNNIYKYTIIILKRSIRSLSSRSHARGSSRGGPGARVQQLQQLLQLQSASTYIILYTYMILLTRIILL